MGKYCCFFDPSKSYEDKRIDDLCPVCKRPYDYVLKNAPKTIVRDNLQYNVIKAVGRGFYGATYLCEVEKRFSVEKVLLKVVPVEVYSFFGKDFEEECRLHFKVAENTIHLVKIKDAFETNITFGDTTIECYVAELEYVNGVSLLEFVNDDSHIDAKIYAQITIDLLMLWNEFVQKGEFHNDLHLENIMVEQFVSDLQRTDAIYDRIQLKAIDLNSVADGSLSDSEGRRIGDRKYISNHILMLSNRLRQSYENINNMNTTDHRLMLTMQQIAGIFAIPASLSDQPEVSELIDMIKNEFKSDESYAPWLQKLSLTRLTDKINAQTLSSCFVPQLLIDPDDQWIEKISISEPQLITGMRGCGKTMLLKALDVHARLNTNNTFDFQSDTYIGIMANCREFYQLPNIKSEGITKLLLLYSIEILRAARHVRDIDSTKVKKNFHISVSQALEKIFSFKIDEQNKMSDYSLERYLSELSNFVIDFNRMHPIRVTTIEAFELLANSLNSVSELFRKKKVFFLLDDASTRYLDLEKIDNLLTELLFMSEKCAFKITTERQTLFSFKSPGNIEEAQEIRDFAVFDLGADVYDKTRTPAKAKNFIEKIINKRIERCSGYENIPRKLKDVLVDCELIDIANHIINHNIKSAERQSTYHGVTALVSLCVGDIGDIISLYDSILSRNGGNKYPVKENIQHKAFQNLCSHRMYYLEGKNTLVRDCIRAFAEASYYDLLNSKNAITKSGNAPKIRQYNSLHISNITSDKQDQYIRKLIDSGVFVYSDKNGQFRRNNRTIKLAFRKLFGLTYFIPLGNSDRYELSGEAFEKWVDNPSKEVLIKNSGNNNRPNSHENVESVGNDNTNDINEQLKEMTGYQFNRQITLSDFEDIGVVDADETEKARMNLISSMTKLVSIQNGKEGLTNNHFGVAVFGLGFEDRCIESMKKIVEKNTFKKIILIKYKEKGHSEGIIKLANKYCDNVVTIRFDDLDEIEKQITTDFNILIDLSGLYKPIIFNVIRNALIQNKEVTVVHTFAKEYFPLNTDIERLLNKYNLDDANALTEIMKELTTGDEGEYSNVKLLSDRNYDVVRPKSLVGFVSPKNKRIYSILNDMDFEKVVLFVPNGDSNRDILSNVAGTIAENNYSGVCTKQIDLTNPENVFKEIIGCYVDLYIDQESNFDLALTGSKMQAVVAAVFSSIAQISQCWYVEPSKFDTEHFTKGVGETVCYRIKLCSDDL